MTMHKDDDLIGPVGPADDEALEPWLQALVDEYDTPPAPAPRELMWARIQAARQGGAEPAAEPAAEPGDELARRRERRDTGAGRPWVRSLLALAATLLLGVAIGRFTSGSTESGTTGAGAAPIALVGPATVQAPPAPETAGAPATPEAAAPVVAAQPPAPDRAPTTPPSGGTVAPSAPRMLATAPEAGTPPVPDAPTPDTPASDALSTPYRMAAVQHLGEAEFLLTSFRLDAAAGNQLPTLQPWARELLTTTRLMLDSPVGRDNRLGPLLGDLEMVLTQIVQLPAARAAEERQLIARSLERNDLMTQLRTAVPAGPAVPQRSGE